MIIGEIARQLGVLLLTFNFNEPEKDQILLRQHAYVKGKWEQLRDLLSYDQDVLKKRQQEAEELQQANLDREAADSNLPDPTAF